ncbi:hypothetical protein CcaCcLH18_09629 [Colletotrichum camelliae]|nr:hypothetical protein CcaCcLH18_09629 [Colletotrichum camelliae]
MITYPAGIYGRRAIALKAASLNQSRHFLYPAISFSVLLIDNHRSLSCPGTWNRVISASAHEVPPAVMEPDIVLIPRDRDTIYSVGETLVLTPHTTPNPYGHLYPNPPDLQPSDMVPSEEEKGFSRYDFVFDPKNRPHHFDDRKQDLKDDQLHVQILEDIPSNRGEGIFVGLSLQCRVTKTSMQQQSLRVGDSIFIKLYDPLFWCTGNLWDAPLKVTQKGLTGFPHLVPEFFGSWTAAVQSTNPRFSDKLRHVRVLALEYIDGIQLDKLFIPMAGPIHPTVKMYKATSTPASFDADEDTRMEVMKKLIWENMEQEFAGITHGDLHPRSFMISMRHGDTILDAPRVLLIGWRTSVIDSLSKDPYQAFALFSKPMHPFNRFNIIRLHEFLGWISPTWLGRKDAPRDSWQLHKWFFETFGTIVDENNSNFQAWPDFDIDKAKELVEAFPNLMLTETTAGVQPNFVLALEQGIVKDLHIKIASELTAKLKDPILHFEKVSSHFPEILNEAIWSIIHKSIRRQAEYVAQADWLEHCLPQEISGKIANGYTMKTIKYQIDELESEKRHYRHLNVVQRDWDQSNEAGDAYWLLSLDPAIFKSGLSAADAIQSEDSRIRELGALIHRESIDRRNLYDDVQRILVKELGKRAKSFGAADVLGGVYRADTLRKLNGRRTVDRITKELLRHLYQCHRRALGYRETMSVEVLGVDEPYVSQSYKMGSSLLKKILLRKYTPTLTENLQSGVLAMLKRHLNVIIDKLPSTDNDVLDTVAGRILFHIVASERVDSQLGVEATREKLLIGHISKMNVWCAEVSQQLNSAMLRNGKL